VNDVVGRNYGIIEIAFPEVAQRKTSKIESQVNRPSGQYYNRESPEYFLTS
jgi:hypothetical protein